MKHYRICIEAERHPFEYCCSTISEAYDAIQDASTVFGLNIDLDKVMVDLVGMHEENIISSSCYRLRISKEDGEV